MSDKVYQITDNSRSAKDKSQNKEKSILQSGQNQEPNQNQNVVLIPDFKETEILKTNTSKKDSSANLAIINYKEIIDKYEKREKDYIEKMDNLNRIIELERSNSANIQRELNDKMKEIREKEKTISTITNTNNKLMSTLEILKKDVDEKLDKVSFKQVTEKMKPTKENPLDIVLKVKEKELKNTMNLLEILKKDNENLKKSVNDQININSYIELRDRLKQKETQIVELSNEIKTLSRSSDEHNKCIEIKKEFETEKKILKDEIRRFKENIRDLNFKLKEEEIKHAKTKDNLINMKRQIEASNRSLLINKINVNANESDEKIQKIKNLNHDENLVEVLEKENNNEDKMNEIKKNEVIHKNIMINNKKKLIEKARSRDASLNQKIIGKKPKTNEENNKDILFNTEEKVKLEKIFDKEDIEKFEKKYEFLDHSRQAMENKLKLENKIVSKKLSEKEDQLEYLTLQFKETEQKNKIYQFQMNEYKNEQKVFHRKITDMQTNLKNLYGIIREKEQENKLLISQLTNLRKLVKHNAVPPMDSEVIRHLEKIKANENDEENLINNSQNNIKEVDRLSIDGNSVKLKRNSIKFDDTNILEDKLIENENVERTNNSNLIDQNNKTNSNADKSLNMNQDDNENMNEGNDEC